MWFDHGTPMGFVVFGSVDNASTTTWILHGLYTIVKSYSKNNNNHLAILPEICGLLTR